MFGHLIRDAVNSWTPGLGRAYRRVRDERAVSTPPAPTPYGFKFAGFGRAAPAGMKDEIDVFLQYLHRSSACIDIGANVGLYSCLAASRGKSVIAVEPLAVNLARLYKNLVCNEFLDVEVYPIGLASRPGLKRIYGTGLNA
jgi:hypothetical protein